MTILKTKNIAILGYGNHGRPQALNLKDGGFKVTIGLRPQSITDNTPSAQQAQADGLPVMSFAQAVAWADVLMMILPDEHMGKIFDEWIRPHLQHHKPQYLGFCHGLAIHAGWLKPPETLNVFLAGPKAHGLLIREKFLAGSGVLGLLAVHQNPAGNAGIIAQSYLSAQGCDRVGIIQTTFAEETTCDIFSEQAVLCGGISRLIAMAFQTLVEAGYSPQVAYLRCVLELKSTVDLLHQYGLTGMRQRISSTALYGDLSRGDRLLGPDTQAAMKTLLAEIESGQFMAELSAQTERAALKPGILDEAFSTLNALRPTDAVGISSV